MQSVNNVEGEACPSIRPQSSSLKLANGFKLNLVLFTLRIPEHLVGITMRYGLDG
jgi:hypothetical protein